VICFDRVVRILIHDVTGARQQLIEHAWVDEGAVGGHFGRCGALVKRTGEEPAGGFQIPLLADQDVDNLAELVDRPIQVDPSSRDFDVCFVDEPPISGGVPAGSCRVDEQRGEPLHPPVHAHVVNINAPLRQQLFDVPV
jgi:hypothetical protein